jgi:hypothetical protein
MTIRVAVVNGSKSLKDEEIRPVVAALQKQVSQHLAPRWHVDATLDLIATGKAPPA